jgi:hypothetical protein
VQAAETVCAKPPRVTAEAGYLSTAAVTAMRLGRIGLRLATLTQGHTTMTDDKIALQDLMQFWHGQWFFRCVASTFMRGLIRCAGMACQARLESFNATVLFARGVAPRNRMIGFGAKRASARPFPFVCSPPKFAARGHGAR